MRLYQVPDGFRQVFRRRIRRVKFDRRRPNPRPPRRQLQLDAAQRLNPFPDGFPKAFRRIRFVGRGRRRRAERRGQNVPRLLRHGAAVLGGLGTQPVFKVRVQVADGDAGHLSASPDLLPIIIPRFLPANPRRPPACFPLPPSGRSAYRLPGLPAPFAPCGKSPPGQLRRQCPHRRL